MHDNTVLGGPVWYFAVTVIALSGFLAFFVLVDGLLKRKGRGPEGLREPMGLYLVGEAVFLVTLLFPSLVPGVSWISAVPVVLMPFAIGLGVAYLLRVVFPKAGPQPGAAPGASDDDSGAGS